MTFQIPSADLLDFIHPIASAYRDHQAMPILETVNIDYDGARQLCVTGTDLQTQLRIQRPISCQSPGESMRFCVNARKLADILKLAPKDSTVRIKLDDERLSLRIGTSRYTLTTLPTENFPAFDSEDIQLAVTLSAERLLYAFSRVQFAIAQNDVRHYLNGCAIKLTSEAIETIASDGHRLAIQTINLNNPPEGIEATDQALRILPRKAVLDLIKLLTDSVKRAPHRIIKLSLGSRVATVAFSDSSEYSLEFSIRLIEGQYPDAHRVIPRKIDAILKISAFQAIAAINRAMVLADSKEKAITMRFDATELGLSASNQEADTSDDSLAIDLDGTPMIVAFNGGYVLDALNVVSPETIEWCLAPNGSLMLDTTDPGWKAVVMPMRI